MSSKKPNLHKVSILGVRDFEGSLYTNSNHVRKCLEDHFMREGLALDQIHVVTGGGGGVESMVIEWCTDNNIPFRKIPPDIQTYGTPKAFIVRNSHVVSEGQELIVFWDAIVEVITQTIITATHQRKRTTVFPLA